MKKSFILIGSIAFSLVINLALPGNAEVSITINGSKVELSGEEGVSHIGTVEGCVEGNGKEKTEVRPVVPFSAINIDGIFDVIIDFQKKTSLSIRGEENILPFVTTQVNEKTLSISSNKSICPKRSLVVTISVENIDKLTTDGSNDVFISKMKNREFAVYLNGSSDLTASGMTQSFFVKILGNGTVLAKDLQAEEAKVVIDGSGDAVVYASKKLTAEVNGVGDIQYYGNPPNIIRRINGVGDIEAR